MNAMRIFMSVALLSGIAATSVARSGALPFSVDNRLRLEFDDNIYQSADNEQDSMKIVEQIRLSMDVRKDNTFLTLRYQPSLFWWADRDAGDDTDLFHEVDAVLNQTFSPRFRAGVQETFRYSDQSELRSQDLANTVIRGDNTYSYNKVGTSASYRVAPEMDVRVEGSWDILRYEEQEVADRDDYDVWAAGGSVNRILTPESTIGLQGRWTSADYVWQSQPVVAPNGTIVDSGNAARNSDGYQVGVTYMNTFSPNLVGNARAGYEMKSFDASYADDSSQPFGSLDVTILPSPRTRLNVGGSYGLYEADVYPYTNQVRTTLYGSIGYDVTAKVDVFGSALLASGEYDADEAVTTVTQGALADGNDDSIQFVLRTRYNIMRNQYLELGWQYTKLDSDLRSDYDRNRVWVGWQARL